MNTTELTDGIYQLTIQDGTKRPVRVSGVHGQLRCWFVDAAGVKCAGCIPLLAAQAIDGESRREAHLFFNIPTRHSQDEPVKFENKLLVTDDMVLTRSPEQEKIDLARAVVGSLDDVLGQAARLAEIARKVSEKQDWRSVQQLRLIDKMIQQLIEEL